VTKKDVEAKEGKEIMSLYPSLFHALKAVYPTFAWEELKFADAAELAKRTKMDTIGSQLGIQKV